MVRARDDLENWYLLLELIDKEKWREARNHAVKCKFADGFAKWGPKSKRKKGQTITALQSAYNSNDLDYMSAVLGREINDKDEMLTEIIKKIEEETENLTAPIVVAGKYYFRSYYEFMTLIDYTSAKKYAEDKRNSSHLLNKIRTLGFDAQVTNEYIETDNRPFFEEYERRKNGTLLYQYKGVLYDSLDKLVLYNEEFHDKIRGSSQNIMRMLLKKYNGDFSVVVADEDSLEKSKMCDWKREKFPKLEPVKRVMKLRNESGDWKKIALLSGLKRNTFIYIWRQIEELDL